MFDDTNEDADSHDLIIRIFDRLRIRLIFMTELYPFFIAIFSIIFYLYFYDYWPYLIVQLLLNILFLTNTKKLVFVTRFNGCQLYLIKKLPFKTPFCNDFLR